MPVQVSNGASTGLERVLVYSDPKSGKTRFVTSLPERFGDIMYCAWDDNSETLRSVLDKYKPRIKVVKSISSSAAQYDPVAEAFDMIFEWQKYAPSAKTIVWDTMSTTGDIFLNHIASKGQFSDSKHIVVGAKDGPGRYVIPMEGDYGGAQNSIRTLTSYLVQMPLHVIVTCHSKFDEPKSGGTIEGGPATVGNATVRTYSKPYDVVVYLEKRTNSAPNSPPKTVVTAFTEKHGIWQASIREGKGRNPMPKVELEADPINFWNLYDKEVANAPLVSSS